MLIETITNMKILITGINGFLGQHLARALISRGHFVRGLDLREKSLVENISDYVAGNILDKKITEKAIEGMEAVVHMAALTAHQEIVDNRFETLEINFLGTKNILDVFSKSASGKKFIYSSTGKVYGDIKFLPITEEHPTLPINILGKSKLITERLIDFYNNNEKSFVIFRIFNAFGLNQKDSFLIPTILNQIKKSAKITLGDTEAKRDYVYISDVIAAFVLAVEKNINPGLSIFNICSGQGFNAKNIVSEISRIKNVSITVSSDPKLFRKEEEKDVEYGSYEKAEQILGWRPQYSLKRGLEEIIKLSK